MRAREISVPQTIEETHDTLIDNRTVQTNDSNKRPWNIPARQPIRGRKQHKYARKPAILNGNGFQTVTVATGTVTTGTITPPTEDSFSTVSEQPPVVEKIVRKVKKSRPAVLKEEESVQVTLDSDDRPKTTDPTEKHSYTLTYNTANPTSVSQVQNSYKYTFETVTVDRPSDTLETKTEIIKSTDSFTHEMAKPVSRGSSRHSTRDGNEATYTSRRSTKAGNESHHSSRHGTREGSQYSSRKSSKPVEQLNDNESIKSLNKSRTSTITGKSDQNFSSRHSKTRHSTREGNEYSSRASSKKQTPAPPLSQPSATLTTNHSGSTTGSSNQGKSPLEAILLEQEKNGIIITPTAPSSSNSVAANSNTQTQSKKTLGSYSDGPELDSNTLGDVSSNAGSFKADSINNEKLGSDKEFWANK
jgi:hypothetical protein